MEEQKTYKWINLRVEKEVHDKVKAAAEADYLPVATFAKKVLMEAIAKISLKESI
jgi:predicted HicB family RNase H-like nuclease